jgi:hypothetical protein
VNRFIANLRTARADPRIGDGKLAEKAAAIVRVQPVRGSID